MKRKLVFASSVAGAIVAIGSTLAWLTLSREVPSSGASSPSQVDFNTSPIAAASTADRMPAGTSALPPEPNEDGNSEQQLTPVSADDRDHVESSGAGQLPFAHGSLEERVWILRRALHDLEELGTGDRAVEKLGYEMLPTAVGGILDAQGRGMEQPQGKHNWPVANEHQRVVLSQSKYFVFERFEFPEYETFLGAVDAKTDWTLLGDRSEWMSLARARVDDAILLMKANIAH